MAAGSVGTDTISGLVDRAAETFGDAEALVDGDVRWSWIELRERIDEAARALMASGVEKGDTVAVWAPNMWEWVVAAIGVHRAGGVLIPINTRFKGAEAEYLLERSRAKILFTVTDFLSTNYVELIEEAGAGKTVDEIVVLRGTAPPDATSFADFLARADGVTHDEAQARAGTITADDVCHIMFTSGTTGAPKGAMLAHGPICRIYAEWAEIIGLRSTDRYLMINPYFHSFGLNAGILACFTTGATMIPHPVFDVDAVMERVPLESVTMLPGPPAIYQTILNHSHLERFDMSSLRLAVTGAAAVPVQMVHDMKDRLSFEAIVTGYGLTESSGTATMCRHDDDPETIATTSGRAIEDVEVIVADDDGNEVPRGEQGEILIRGYNVMRGYLDDPEQTAEAIDEAGWLHSGDIGVMDERGYVKITDRKKDMYIVGGFNAYPAEIEDMLIEHPAVGQVAVIGMPDERLGEVGVAYVVPAPDTAPTEDELVAWARSRMANYKVPRHVELVDELPLNASGKVLKYVLRERAASSTA